MDLPMFLDVPDLPACLRRWDSTGQINDGLLKVPSCDDLRSWNAKDDIFSLDNQDESCSGLSLGSSPSNASSALNVGADLGLNFEFEFFDEVSEQTCGSIETTPCSPAVLSLPNASVITGLPLGKLNLKLDFGAVASSWQSMAGNAPAFKMARSDLVYAAAGIPCADARAASLAVDAQEGWNMGPVSPPAASPKPEPVPVATKAITVPKPVAPPARPAAPRPPKKSTASSSQKRRGSGTKPSDKRPRIKGRFVRRDELERFLADKDCMEVEAEADSALVPDAITINFVPPLC